MKFVDMGSRQKYLHLVLIITAFTLFSCSSIIQTKAPVRSSSSDSQTYIEWLEKQSMLFNADKISYGISGQGIQWKEPYARPKTQEIVNKASVWVLGYPGSMITRPGESVLHLWADDELWRAFSQIGIELLHTGPVKRAGGINNYNFTPTIDGWFDRISYDIDPQLGTEEEYRLMVKRAAKYNSLIAGDLVPLHTGKGSDFLLALRNYKNYPGIYTMVEINKEDWPLLPEVNDMWSSAAVSKEVIAILKQKSYVPGYINSCDAVPDAAKLSGWDATGQIKCADGKIRKWVYLHYFKPGQPAMDWLDPTFNAQKIIAGDAVRTIHDLGAKVVRLDAVPFLGIEPVEGSPKALDYRHPLAAMGTNYTAFLIRKLGGWSFQELNMSYEDIKVFSDQGADLSYDFFTRTESLHALLTGDAALLRFSYNEMLNAGIKPISLVHDLQNHDEITYQLVQLEALGNKKIHYKGKMTSAKDIREQVLNEMRQKASGPNTSYNKLYRAAQDGVATTFAGFISAAFEISDPYHASKEQIEQIKRGHLVLTAFNALQPGVFSLSGWDIVGALPLSSKQVEHLLNDNDFRWLNRGAIDLMDYNKSAQKSSFGLPRAAVLYGTITKQLEDSNSFVRQLKNILKVRKDYGIALSEVLSVYEVNNPGTFILIMILPDNKTIAVTAINFSRTNVEEKINLPQIKGLNWKQFSGHEIKDALKERREGIISKEGSFTIKIENLDSKLIIIN